MTAEYVRSYYGVPAKRGVRVLVDGRSGVITGFARAQPYIRVRFDDDPFGVSVPAHPTWRVDYLAEQTGDE